MKRNKFIQIGVATILSIIALTSCDKFLDINDNPNYPTDAGLSALPSSSGATTIAQLGLNGTLIGTMWMQYTTQGNSTNQYNTTVNYQVTTAEYNAFWTNAYANTLEDLKQVVVRAEKQKAWNYWVIGKILTAYNYHILTDLYEDIPFTQALDPVLYPKPKFDDSKTVVYPGIIKMLDEAIAKSTEATASGNPKITKEDVFFNGDVVKWIAFAKSLKLKVMMRDFNTYKSQIESLLSAGGFLVVDCAMTSFEDGTYKANPFYEFNIRQVGTTENVRACHTLLVYLLANKDPRIEGIYEVKLAALPTATEYADKYEGIPCGTKPSLEGPDGLPLVKTSRLKQKYSDPVYLMNAAETNFLVAEAYARLDNKIKAEEFYKSGVKASFNRWPTSAGKADSFLTGAYKFNSTSIETMLVSILEQKWVSYAGANGLDGVFDRNRTGFPKIDPVHTVRVSDTNRGEGLTPGYVLGTLVALGTSVLQGSEFPRRLLIPDASTQYNPNAPKTKAITEPMWWQVAKGL